MQTYVIMAYRETLTFDPEVQHYAGVLTVEDDARLHVEDFTVIAEDEQAVATIVVAQPVLVAPNGNLVTRGEMQRAKEAALAEQAEQPSKPRAKGGRRSKGGLELVGKDDPPTE